MMMTVMMMMTMTGFCYDGNMLARHDDDFLYVSISLGVLYLPPHLLRVSKVDVAHWQAHLHNHDYKDGDYDHYYGHDNHFQRLQQSFGSKSLWSIEGFSPPWVPHHFCVMSQKRIISPWIAESAMPISIMFDPIFCGIFTHFSSPM